MKNVKKILEIDMVYVFHCCALADLPRRIKQSLQERMEEWKQRSKALLDQIYAVDPHYVPSNEYRFVGQASYADIAAGRTSPSSRNCSPYRQQRDVTPSTTATQVLRPALVRVQKSTVECLPLSETQVSKTQVQESNLDKPKPQAKIPAQCVQTVDDQAIIAVEEKQQDIPEVLVESPVTRRGRSPTRKMNSSSVRCQKTMMIEEEEIHKYDNRRFNVTLRQEARAESVKNILAPHEERKGRSPSPMWVPGSTSYADILRGRMQATQANTTFTEAPRQEMVPLSGESSRRAQSPCTEQVQGFTINVDESQQIAEASTQEAQVENVQVAETYCQSPEISAIKMEEQSYAESGPDNWTDENLEDMLQQPYENVPGQPVTETVQSTEIYDPYMVPEPKLIGFIGSQLRTYPVSSYVYTSSGHQQVQQLDTANLNPYNNSSLTYAPEHYVVQTAYLASDIYQQTPMQQQCPVSDTRHEIPMLVEKPIKVSVARQEVPEDTIVTESIDESKQEEPANVSEACTTSKTEGRDALPLSDAETKAQIFSYAQILSQGLTPRVTSTHVINKSPIADQQNKEQPSSLFREVSPLKELKNEQDSHSIPKSQQVKVQSKKNDWDTIKKREIKKRQSSDKTEQTDEKKTRKLVDKPIEKQKKEKLSPVSVEKQLETVETPDESNITSDSSEKERIEERPMQQTKQEKPIIYFKDANQEKKRKQKKKKIDKSVGDEIDKALKEIEDMDKQKIKSQREKVKEQIEEQNKSQNSANETLGKSKVDEKKQKKLSDTFIKSGKTKEIVKIKENEQDTLSQNQIKLDQCILKDNENKEDTKDVKALNSNDEEKVQKDTSSKILKYQSETDINVISDKSDIKIKHKTKTDKSTKDKGQREKYLEDKIQKQSDVLSDKKNDEINITTESNKTENVKAVPNIELEDEKSNTVKIESTKKQKDASKKEKNKTKSKKSELDTENKNKNQEKFENDSKEIIDDKSPESIEPIIEKKDSKPMALDTTKIANKVNSNAKDKIKKKNKTSKSKTKAGTINHTQSIILANTVLDEAKINFNDTKIQTVRNQEINVPKSEQLFQTKIAEAAEVIANFEIQSKEVESLSSLVSEIHQDMIQTDITYKNDKTRDGRDKTEEKLAANIKLEADNLIRESSEITDRTDEKKANNMIEKTETEKIEKRQKKQKKSQKAKFNAQDKNKISTDDIKTPQLESENKSVKEKDEMNIESLSKPSNASTIEVQEQDIEKTNLTEHVTPDICLIEIKTDAENNLNLKIDEKENVTKRVPSLSKSKKKDKSKSKAVIQSTASAPNVKYTEKSTEKSDLSDIVIKEKEISEPVTYLKKEELNKNSSSPAKIDNFKSEETQELLKVAEAEPEFNSKVSSDSIDEAKIHEQHKENIHVNNNLESEQLPSTGKALIIEKTVTTVTTTTTNIPGSIKEIKPVDVKSVKSVEILENIPLPKIIGSKVTELITLRPETVEASLTTTYARVPNDFSTCSCPAQSDQAVNSQKIGLISASSTENITTPDESAALDSISKKFNDETLEDEKGELVADSNDDINDAEKERETDTREEETCSDDIISQNNNIVKSQDINKSAEIDNTTLINKNNQDVSNTEKKELEENIEQAEIETKCENDPTISKIKSENTYESVKTKKQIIPDYLDVIKPYAIDRHAYNHAESNFYRHFKIVKVIKEVQPPATVVPIKPENIEKIVQESVMKPKSTNRDIDCRRHAFIIETPKYPISSFYEIESQWIKNKSIPQKSILSTNNFKDSTVENIEQTIKNKTTINAVSDEEIRLQNTTLINTTDNIELLTDKTEDTNNTSIDLTLQAINKITELNDSIPSPVEKISDNQLVDAEEVTDRNIQIEETNTEDNIKTEQELKEIKTSPAVISSINLKSDDAWIDLLDEEIILDDDFDVPETQAERDVTIDNQIEKKEEKIKKEAKIEKPEEEVEKREIERQKEQIEKRETIIEEREEKDEQEKAKIETSDHSTLMEIAVKDEYHTGIEDIQNNILESKKQSDKIKNQPKRKKESKHTKDVKIKDNTKSKGSKKQNVEIKTDATESDLLPTQSNPEENKTLKKITESKIEQFLIADEQQSESSKDNAKLKDTIDKAHEKPLSKIEEHKPKSNKKSKKQSEKSAAICKEKLTTSKYLDNTKEDDDNVFCITTEIESNALSIQKQQELIENNVPKYDSSINSNAKPWATIVDTKDLTETTVLEDDSLNTQTSAIICQDTINSAKNIAEEPQASVMNISCEIPPKQDIHFSSLENQTSKDINEELKVTTTDEIDTSIAEKSIEEKQLKENNKSYAQVAATSRRTPPKTPQGEINDKLNTGVIESILLKPDEKINDAKLSNEKHGDLSAEKFLEQDKQVDKTIMHESVDQQTDIAKSTFQSESIPWVEEVEKETSLPSTCVYFNGSQDDEPYTKLETENTWAAIVGKKSIESPEANNVPSFEQNLHKEPLTQVQIYVEETLEREPIENLIQVDEQGFMEFVNRKELRSRRSRSRSRSARRNDGQTIMDENKKIKTPNVKTKKKIEDKNKKPAHENEQTIIDVDELTNVKKDVQEAKPSEKMITPKNKNMAKQQKDSNKRKKENEKQLTESEIQNTESKTIQEIKPEQDETFEDRKSKSEENKSNEDQIKHETEISNESQSKNIAIESQKIKDIDDQSIQEIQLVKNAQENTCKNVKVLQITEQSNVTKSKKKSKNKKAKVITEQLIENACASDISKKAGTTGDLEERKELLTEPKLDGEIKIKLEEADSTDITYNKSTNLENERIPAEETNKQENIEQQVMICDETREQESIEQNMVVCEPKMEERPITQVEEQAEISKPTKAEKRRQKKKAKALLQNEPSEEMGINKEEDVVQNKSTDLFNINTDVIEDIKVEKAIEITEKDASIAPLIDKIDVASVKKNDESITEIQTAQIEAVEKSEPVIENKTLLLQVNPKEKEKHKNKAKAKKEKRLNATKSQDFIKTSTADSTEIEPLLSTENTDINISKDIISDITQTKEEDVKDKKIDNKITTILQFPEDKSDISVTSGTAEQENIKKCELLASSEKEIAEIKNLPFKKEEKSSKKHDAKIEDKQKDLPKCTEGNITDIIDENISTLNEIIDVTAKETKSSSDYSEEEKKNVLIETQHDKDLETFNEQIQEEIKHEQEKSIETLNELSSTAQQDEDKLKRVESIEQENFDVSIEPPKSKVQFYIADEILVLSPDRRKTASAASLLQEQPPATSKLCNSQYLSIDHGFWPDKRSYHEAERDHFENLSMKKRLSHGNGRDSDDRHRPRDHDDDRDGGNSGGRSRDTQGDSRFLFGSPHTERMIADLPGGICSWRDYSTYLSNESERTPDHNLSHGVINNQAVDSDSSLPNDVRLSSVDLLLTSSSSHDPRTDNESHTKFLVDEVNPKEHPAISNSFQSPDDPSTCIQSSTLAHLGPQSKLHLGKETRQGSMQRCSSDEEMEKETTEDEIEKGIRRIQDTVEEGLASLQTRLLTFEESMGYLPTDSLESMLSSVMTMLMELRTYDEEVAQLEKRLYEIPADIESQRLLAALTEIHTRVTSLLDQAEQGRSALDQAREAREKRSQEIRTYKLFLEETDTWLRNVVLKIDEQHSFNTKKILQEELRSRANRVSELESLPEVSELAIEMKKALMNAISQLSQKQQEIGDEEADDESTEKDNATLDEAPSINSSLDGGPSLADVSLQTGQSLLIDDVVKKRAQVTKQTSTTQIPSSTTCHSLTTQTTEVLLPSEAAQTQEAIKILKTTKGDHDVIEIATKYLPSNSNQELIHQEQASALPSEDIVVDMKYQDAKKTDSATSELNIVHAAPQSFETVLVEPDDITTEVVVDADGTKRIIVRKLRRTTKVSKQTTQQHMSALSTTLGDAPLMMQAFSEAAMRDQQVTVTKTRPDGTIETITRQIYGGKVTTGAGEGISVEEYESEPRYTHMVTQGQIGDINQPAEEEILMEGGEYQTRTSSVHAVVQQVTKRVIKKTRKIIRKVTIIDGKETATEEVIEEPEEIEINEQDIPHISINVVKSEDQKVIIPAEKEVEIQQQETMRSKHTPDSTMQGPFFGPSAKDMMNARQDKTKEEITEKSTITEKDDETPLKEPLTADSKIKLADSEQTEMLSPLGKPVLQVENLINVADDESVSILQRNKNIVPKEMEAETVREHFSAEINGISALAVNNQALIDAERSAVLQTPVEDVTQAAQPELLKSPTKTDEESVVTKTSCKSDDAPVKVETLNIELENGTVEVEMHHDVSSTVEADTNVDKLNVVLLEKEDEKEGISKEDELFEPPKSEEEEVTLASLQQSEPKNKSIILPCEINIDKSKYEEISLKEREIFVEETEDNLKDEALKPEYKPVFHKVEIALSVSKEDEEMEPLVSVKTQAERSDIAPCSIVKEDVDINLPMDKKTTGVIHDKIVQTNAFLTAEKETETLQQTASEVVDVHIESSEQSKSDTMSHKSKKKKRHKDKTESSEKPTEEESSISIATSIAESMEINIPSSDSSKHPSEQPQPDVAEIIRSNIESSLSLDDSIITEENGYQPDDNDVLSIAAEDEIKDGTKRKRKKKKKQKIRSSQADLTQVPKTSSDNATFTDDKVSDLEISKFEKVQDSMEENKNDSIAIEKSSIKHITEEDQAKETEVEQATQQQENIECKVVLDDANTQTAIETCDVSTSFTPKIGEESSSTFMQTSPEPLPLTLEEESQTDKTQEIHIETQTILEPEFDIVEQNIVEGIPEVENLGTQTMTPVATPVEEFAVQTSPIEDVPIVETEMEDSQAQTIEIDVFSTEMQTSPVEVASMITNETQTIINTAMEVEQQTTPPPVAEEVILQESGIQTLSPIIPESLEKDVQTNVSSPEQLNVLHTDTQTISIPEASTETIETQTSTPEEVKQQEIEVKSMKEATMQTSPTFVSPEPVQICEESIQTSIEEPKQTVEEESQTRSPEKTQTFDSSIQIGTDLIPQVEESVQNIPDMCEISSQTLLEKESQPVEMTSISQQTTSISTHTVETSTEDSKIEVAEEEDTHKTFILEEAVKLKEMTEKEKIFTEMTETPAASDVQVRKIEEVREMEVASDRPETSTTVIEERKTSVEKDISPQFFEIPVVKDLKSNISVKTEDSMISSSTSERNVTPDTSFEIHVHASIELSASDTLDNTSSKETPDSSQDTTITEDLNNDAEIAESSRKAIKRQRRKRKHKTMEINLSSKDKPECESIFEQPIKTQDTLKLSYCDIAKKNVVQTPLVGDNDEYFSQTTSQIESDQVKKDIASSIIIESASRHEEEDVPDTSTTSKTILTSDQFMIDSNLHIPETIVVSEAAIQTPFLPDRPMMESFLSSNQEKLFAITSTQSPELIDTTEEPLSSIEIPTYVESHKKLEPALPDTEKKETNLWQESVSEVPPLNTSSSLLEKSLEYDMKSQYSKIPQAMQAAKIITDRVKNLQNTNESSYLGNILHIAHLEEVTTERLVEERSSDVRKELVQLRNAIEEDDVVIVEEAFVTVVETISTWLETIEYRIFLNKECPTGPSHEDARTFVELRDEMNLVNENICELDNIWKELEPSYPEQERERLQKCMDAVDHQMKIVKHITTDEEKHASNQLAKWDEFLNGVNNVYRLVNEQRKQLDDIIESECSTHWKLQELDKLENTNRCHMWKTSELLNITSGLLREYPGKIIPEETYVAHEMTKIIGYNVYVERERLLQLLVLAEEYEQTLQEFAQITDIAEKLLESPISVMSLESLQEEMQKHRKFFVNLNHCRAILESLEGNLDPETRAKHSDLHKKLHDKATALLDQAASRAQQMALAASRWMLLEQSVKEERGWLQVAHQRVPDLQTVTSTDYDQYISLYQSLSSDVASHRARLIQLFDMACSLRDLINIEDPEDHYGEILGVIVKLQDNIESSLRRLLAFRDSWNHQETLMNRVEQWMTMAEKELAILRDPSGSSMRQFWELKAQYEVHNNMRNEADNCFEQALRIIPLSDELLQRQFHYELQDRWEEISNKINEIQMDATRSISSEEISSNEKLKLFEKELNELRMIINSFYGVLKTKEELDLYIERLTVLFDRISLIQDEIGRLGLLPAAESERVGFLLSSARCIEGQISEELDSAQLLREKIQVLQRGLSRFRKAHKRLSAILDQCEGSEKQESDLVAAAVNQCQSVADELAILWQDLMALRQMLHNLPTGMRVTVSPVGIERDLSNIQDVHTELESRCTRLLSLLTNRLELWRRFERQLEMVQQSVQEADYMMELLTVQGSVDYDRLLKATERLEGLNGDLGAREVLIGELRAAAEPLRESCAVEVRERVDAIVNEAVQAWEDTRAELSALCTRYQHACRLWQQYRDSSAAVKAWVDTQMNTVVNLPPEEAVKQVKICEETLAEHKERLAELRGLVAQIASDVGLNADGPLHCEVEALGQRLEDVRETLSTLADTVDAHVLNQELARGDLCQTKNFLDSVQQNLMTVGQGESNEQLTVLRNHLLALTRTEPQLQFIKDRALDMSVQEPSVVEVIRLWQRVFQETFQQYHRLSTRLIRSQDVIAALKLWEEYLTHVQDFLSTGVPSDYNGLSEHRNLCEIHRKLLPEQQNLMLTVQREEEHNRSVTEQFNALTSLHNETLARILERHTAVRDRISAWDKYRLDQSKLLTWLKEVEKERQRLHLQFIHLRRLDKILQRIQALLDKVPTGETQIESLQKQQEYLLTNCEEALAVSIRMEHAANAQRIANLRAGLETWRDFVQRVQKLYEEHIEQSNVITGIFQEISQALSAAFHAKPTSLFKTKEQLDSLQHLRIRLADAQRNLESLGVITEQLRECLSPSDMKTLNQHDALLSQQYADLEYQLALLAYRLAERCNLHGRWENRLNKLLSWIEDTTLRMQDTNAIALDEPEEMVKRLANELQAEISLKQRELEWLQTTGQELIDIAEETEKAKLQRSLTEVNEKWNRLMVDGKARTSKLVDLIQTMNSLLKKIVDLRTWLTGIEGQLSEPLIIEKPMQKSIDKKLEDHEYLKTTIEAESGNISQVLNLCEILLSDCDTWKAFFNTDAIKNGMNYLERRWKIVCVKSTERKKRILMIWKLLQELDKTKDEYEPWLSKTEKSLSELEKDLTESSKEESEKFMEKAKSLARDIEAHQKALKILEQTFGRLAKSGLDPDNFRSLTNETRKIIDRWLAVGMKINAIIPSLQQEQKTYREFVYMHGAAVVGLTQVDVRLTQMQHLATPEQKSSLRRRRQQLREIEEELDTQNVTLRKADELALQLMQESNSDDVAAIQGLVDEYQLLWRDIRERVTMLRTDLETQEKSEVDEAVQVETLKFEQDTAVQVDTLPRLTKMTSCDAYLIELEAALNECNNALNTLEAAVTPDPVSGPGLNATAKTIAKLIGSCQSSIELVRHFHTLLMEDDKLGLGIAKSSEVTTLVARYDSLIALARKREQQIRELSDNGRLTCPLCSRRNWAQLDNDFWRLDKWLEFAEGTQSEQHSPPSDIEQLEDVIQDHREFLLDLDSHKSIVTSLNIVGAHLADHTEDMERAKELRDRLSVANSRWEKICTAATQWQEQLQNALMTNHQFYRIIEELLAWLERTEVSIRASEPIDLTESTNVIEVKYNKFRELRNDLERCEPRVISLQEATNHLLDEQAETRTRLQELRLRLQSLRRLTGIYTLKLGAALGLDPQDVGLAATSTSLASLSHDLLDEAASGTDQPHTTSTNGDENDRTILVRGYRFLGRVLRVSLPIQALMLLLLGVASLVPSVEDDYNCMLSNNLARSFTPIAFHPNGPPPI